MASVPNYSTLVNPNPRAPRVSQLLQDVRSNIDFTGDCKPVLLRAFLACTQAFAQPGKLDAQFAIQWASLAPAVKQGREFVGASVSRVGHPDFAAYQRAVASAGDKYSEAQAKSLRASLAEDVSAQTEKVGANLALALEAATAFVSGKTTLAMAPNVHLMGATLLELTRIESTKSAMASVKSVDLLAQYEAVSGPAGEDADGEEEESLLTAMEYALVDTCTARLSHVFPQQTTPWRAGQGTSKGADAEAAVLQQLLSKISAARAGRLGAWLALSCQVVDTICYAAELQYPGYSVYRRAGSDQFPSVFADQSGFSPMANLVTGRETAAPAAVPAPVKKGNGAAEAFALGMSRSASMDAYRKKMKATRGY